MTRLNATKHLPLYLQNCVKDDQMAPPRYHHRDPRQLEVLLSFEGRKEMVTVWALKLSRLNHRLV